MTQIARLLAVATDLWAPFYTQGGGGAYTQDKSTYAHDAETKNGGGAYARGGA